jgi:hypothetical protein
VILSWLNTTAIVPSLKAIFNFYFRWFWNLSRWLSDGDRVGTYRLWYILISQYHTGVPSDLPSLSDFSLSHTRKLSHLPNCLLQGCLALWICWFLNAILKHKHQAVDKALIFKFSHEYFHYFLSLIKFTINFRIECSV